MLKLKIFITSADTEKKNIQLNLVPEEKQKTALAKVTNAAAGNASTAEKFELKLQNSET